MCGGSSWRRGGGNGRDVNGATAEGGWCEAKRKARAWVRRWKEQCMSLIPLDLPSLPLVKKTSQTKANGTGHGRALMSVETPSFGLQRHTLTHCQNCCT